MCCVNTFKERPFRDIHMPVALIMLVVSIVVGCESSTDCSWTRGEDPEWCRDYSDLTVSQLKSEMKSNTGLPGEYIDKYMDCHFDDDCASVTLVGECGGISSFSMSPNHDGTYSGRYCWHT